MAKRRSPSKKRVTFGPTSRPVADPVLRALSIFERDAVEMVNALSSREVNIDISVDVLPSKSLKQFVDHIDEIVRIMPEKRDAVAKMAIQELQRITLGRADTHPIEVFNGTQSDKASAAMLRAILQVLRRAPEQLKPGAYGFGDLAALNSIKMGDRRLSKYAGLDTGGSVGRHYNYGDDYTEKQALSEGLSISGSRRKAYGTTSPFDTAWKIIEFGTGIYAPADVKIISGYAKKVGGGGAWYLNPQSKSPTILGQKGAHFLVPARENAEQFRYDERVLGVLIINAFNDIIAGL